MTGGDRRANDPGTVGTVLLKRALRDPDPTLLDRAILLLGAAVAAAPAADPGALGHLGNLGAALRTRYHRRGHDGDEADLTEAIRVLREAVRRTTDGDPALSGRLGNLGLAINDRYERYRDQSDREEAIAVLGRAVGSAREPDRARAASNLALALTERGRETRDVVDLTAAVGCAWTAVQTANDRPVLTAALTNLAAALLGRAELTGAVPDLDAAVTAAETAVASTPDTDPQRELRSATAAQARRHRYVRTGAVEDLQAAIAALAASGGPVTAGGIAALAAARRDRYHLLGDQADLAAVVSAYRSLADRTPAYHPELPERLSNLAVALTEQAQYDERVGRHQQAAALVDEAVALHDRAVALARPPADRRRLALNHAAGRQGRFDTAGDVSDLAAAVDVLRPVLAEVGPDDPARALLQAQLGRTLGARFRATGVDADLHEAVGLLRSAVAGLAESHRDRATVCGGLGSALVSRYVRYGRPADLAEAISWLTAAVAVAGAVDRAHLRSSTANALRLQAELTGETADVDAAVAAARAALAESLTGERSGLLATLGAALDLRDGPEARRETVAVRRRVLEHCPAGDPMRGPWTSDLANSLRRLAEATGDDRIVDDAVALHREAVELTAVTAPEHASVLSNLAGSLRDRWVRDGDDRDLDEALGLLRAAADLATAPAGRRLTAAETMAAIAVGTDRVPDALDGFATAVGLLPAAAWRGGDLATQTAPLRNQKTPWLAAHAAAAALRLDDPDRALALLERGRAVWWSQRLEVATDIQVLRERLPELADRLDRARTVLDRGGAGSGDDEDRVAAAVSWDAGVAELRSRPEPELAGLFEPAWEITDRLRAARLPGAVVVPLVSGLGCYAVVVDRAGIRRIELDRLDLDQLADSVRTYFDALAVILDEDESPAARRAADQALAGMLRWLARSVTDPVLTVLEPVDRIWWCPTGPLTYLPLHAAGELPDRVVSSYTPTLGALLRSYAGEADASVLGVAAPDVPGLRPLPGVARELDELAAALPANFPLTRLEGAAATADAVGRALRRHSWAHLSCHGHQDLQDPVRGALILPDGQLSVPDLAVGTGYHAAGAYLSACQSALGGVELTDEVLHLAAALQFAGFRQVIATLWPVPDRLARRTAQLVYATVTRAGTFDPARAAAGLAAAVRELRRHRPDRPSVWAPYVHIGQ